MAVMEVRNLVVISDLHCGCQLGLCPPEGGEMDQAGVHKPTRLQLKLWKIWREFWTDWVPRVCRGDAFALVVNGDSLQGKKHPDTCWTTNRADQRRTAENILRPIVEREECLGLYMIRGTDAHDGESGEDVESLAEDLGAIRDKHGRRSRVLLKKKVGNGIVNIAHAIGLNTSAPHEATAINAAVVAAFTEAGKSRQAPPDYVIRAHRHRHVKTELPAKDHRAVGIVTPAWQLATPYVFRTIGGQLRPPQIGGTIIRQGDEELYDRTFWKIVDDFDVE